MSERKYKFQKVVFQSDQVGIDIRGGYCSQVRKSSQAYKLGVRPGWRIVNIDGERVPREDREIASLIRACIDAGEEFPVTFRLPPTSTYAGYHCGDVVEALDSTGRQWNKCLIIDIVDDKFSIVYLHNAVRSKKYQAMLRRLASGVGDDWEADFDEELDGEAKSKKKKGKKDKGESKADTAIKKLLKAAIGKEAKSNPKEMIKEYARVSSACSDKSKCKEVVEYIEGKLEDHKHPTRVLKALLLTSYLLAYSDTHCAKMLIGECSESIEEAAQLNKNAKTAAGKAAVSDIKNRVGPQVMALLSDPNALARLRKAAKKQSAAKMTLAPPPGEQGATPQPTTQQETEEAFANLSKLTSKHVAAVPASANLFDPAPEPKPVAQPLGGINLDEIFGGGETTTVQQQPQRQMHQMNQMNQINQGVANMGVSSARQSLHQPQQQQNLWQSNLVDLGTLDGTSPTNPQAPGAKKITLQQMQGEEVDLFSF
mmetsp:Transcript_22917/g.46046  ORF Transcript_22917/g.46046 Transcript_22917/m.46046 type:complete len:483 (-) Transcript_22917:355-1803(-)